eukprot:gene28582-47259_t
MIIFPWMFAAATVHSLGDVLSGSRHWDILGTVGFGFCWGWGSVCFGTAVSM